MVIFLTFTLPNHSLERTANRPSRLAWQNTYGILHSLRRIDLAAAQLDVVRQRDKRNLEIPI
jgi:hypothetical protein